MLVLLCVVCCLWRAVRSSMCVVCFCFVIVVAFCFLFAVNCVLSDVCRSLFVVCCC